MGDNLSLTIFDYWKIFKFGKTEISISHSREKQLVKVNMAIKTRNSTIFYKVMVTSSWVLSLKNHVFYLCLHDLEENSTSAFSYILLWSHLFCSSIYDFCCIWVFLPFTGPKKGLEIISVFYVLFKFGKKHFSNSTITISARYGLEGYPITTPSFCT